MGKMPERLGNYRLTRLVHSGAQTDIWQAMSIDMNEPWVLKVQSPKMLSHPEAARRLRYEFSVASGLKHANTLRVNDFGNEQGFAYLSMQRFNGRSLRQLLKEMDRSLIDENLPLIIDQACAAISHLHQAGWIHTSLKPNHLLIDTDARLRLIVLPITEDCQPLLAGTAQDIQPAQPIAWTQSYEPAQAKIFYTSLEDPSDARQAGI
jgi:serine/threonine protein kinase